MYKSFALLKYTESAEVFKIDFHDLGSPFLVFSPHAGGIEPGTSEICRRIAGEVYSYYLFEGTRVECRRLHITSTLFDEPVLLGLLRTHHYAVSVHGMTNELKKKTGADILLGGLNKMLIGMTSGILRANHFTITNLIENPKLIHGAVNPNNVTNKCCSGEGMQIEISEDLRAKFFVMNFKKKGNRVRGTTENFDRFCDAIRESLADFEILININLPANRNK
jgi:phage replication-related protein YjqB (UPF0714/DUF867 family)